MPYNFKGAEICDQGEIYGDDPQIKGNLYGAHTFTTGIYQELAKTLVIVWSPVLLQRKSSEILPKPVEIIWAPYNYNGKLIEFLYDPV